MSIAKYVKYHVLHTIRTLNTLANNFKLGPEIDIAIYVGAHTISIYDISF